jgi:Domain of unknown function (DUF4263)
MSIPFVDRPPTESEIERFRLFLSSYQDRLGNPFNGGPVYPWIFKDVLIAAFNIPTDEGVSTYRHPFGDSLANREGSYQIHLKSLYSNGLEDFCKKNLIHRFIPSKYWDYLSQFGITQQNYKEKASQVGSVSIDLMRSEEKAEFEKIFYLFLFIDRDRYFSEDREPEICFRLAQYSYSIASYIIDPSILHWLVNEEPDSDTHITFGSRRKLATLLRGYENEDLVLEIKIPEDDPTPLPETPMTNRKKQKSTRKSLLEYELRSHFSDHSIEVRMFLPPSKRLWQSNMLQIERLSTLQIMEYGAIAAIKKQRECSVAQLEELISNDAKEEEFQHLLEKDWWMFGNEYGGLLGKRELALGTQQDFLVRRTADGFLEIIEIKRPLNGKNLIYKTHQENHSRSHYRQELSDAIAQVIDYIDEVENDKYRIYFKEKEDVGKIRAKIIIGRDGDEEQKRSLRNLNSALHGIEILTYDQLLRIAKKSLEYQ